MCPRFAVRANFTAAEDICLFWAVAGREEIYLHPSDRKTFVCLWRHDTLCNFPQYKTREMSPKIMLKRVQAHTSTVETQQVSMNGDSALDFSSLGNLVIKKLKRWVRSAEDCVATLSSWHRKLASTICAKLFDGKPHGIEALISHMRETVFPSTEYESKRLFCQHCCSEGPSSRQNGESKEQYVSRRRRLRDTPDPDGLSNSSQ